MSVTTMMRNAIILGIAARLCCVMSAQGMLAQAGPEDAAKPKPAPLPEGASFQTGPDPKLHHVAVSPDSKSIAVASGTGHVTIYDAATGKQTADIAAHETECFCVDFTQDGKAVISCSADRTLKLWDIASGKPIRQFNGHDGEVKAVACSPDGERVASADSAATIRVWKLSTAEELAAMTGHGDNMASPHEAVTIDALAFSPDGRIVVTEANDETARLWDVIAGKQLRTLPLHDGSVAAVAISPDNTVGASTRGKRQSGSSHLRIWEVATGNIRRVINGHQDDLTCVGFAPDGRTVFSGAGAVTPDAPHPSDLTVRQWDTESGWEIRRFRLSSAPLSLACSPNGEFVAVVSPREGVTIFSLKQPPLTASKEHCKDADDAWKKLDSPDYDTRSLAFNYFVKALPPREAAAEMLKRLPRQGASTAGAGAAPAADDAHKVSELIARLDADNYSMRLTAFDELRALGGAARGELADAAVRNPSAEVRARAAELLSAIGGPYYARPVLVPEILRMLDGQKAEGGRQKADGEKAEGGRQKADGEKAEGGRQKAENERQ